jgi:hypothetical protein
VTDGGTLVYAIKKDVAEAINDRDAIPEFQDTILQVLEMNFIQQYSDYSAGEITFETQWPAKLEGTVSVVNKSSAAEPTAGGFSFKLGRVTASDEVGGGDVAPAKTSTDDSEQVIQKRSKVKAAGEPEKLGTEKALGRKRQR